jgi:hypothetical protein
MASAPPDEKKEVRDPRLEWLGVRVATACKINKVKAWDQKVAAADEHRHARTRAPRRCMTPRARARRQTFLAFFEVAETRLLLITFDAKDDLVPMTKFPAAIRRKSVAFVKRQPVALTIDTMDLELDIQDVAPSPLAQLNAVISEVFLPLMENPRNQERMPEVVAQDMKRQFQRLLAVVAVVLSQTKVRRARIARDALRLRHAHGPGRDAPAAAQRRDAVQLRGDG